MRLRLPKRLVLISALVLFALPASATITAGDVGTKCILIGNTDPLTCTWSGTITTGNLIDVAIYVTNDRTIVSVTDDCATGQTWAVSKSKGGSTNGRWHYSTVVTADCLNGTLSVDLSGAPGNGTIVITEWASTAGWDSAQANHVESTITYATATGTAMASGTFSTTQASTLIVCAAHTTNARTTSALLPTGASEVGAANDQGKLIYYPATTAQTTITCGATLSSSTTWYLDGVVYKDNAAASAARVVIIQ